MPQRRVLVVDDDPDIREIAALALEARGGFEVLPASSGREAIERAAAEQPDAVLLDVMMPDLDGPATFRELRAREETRDVPVVLLTAKVQAADRRSFEELGVAGVLSKPFDPMTLPDELTRLLGWET